ncbi:MAG TPA: GAF domain-containing sensor histidine kinase [Anaerolineae bacterium]|nr:GAF domain-containing sensor histidine kinase [Anaerolineae bacterium]
MFLVGSAAPWREVAVLAIAALSNLLITLLPTQLNRLLRRWPALLALDLAFGATLLAVSGGWRSPYYLFVLSPLLAAAFFFRLRGALIATLVFVPMYGLAVWAATALGGPPPDGLVLSLAVVGFFLVAGLFGYAATLLARVRQAHDGVNQAHRDLEVIHELTLSLQSAADVNEVEERVLEAVTGDLGFPRAIVALVDQNERVITAWLGKARDGNALLAGGLPHPARVPLAPEGGVIAYTLLDGEARLPARDVRTPDEFINRHLGTTPYYIFPMLLREHPVGVLLVDASEGEDAARLQSLQAIASQAAVAVGTTMLCIDRAQRLAVQEERIRFAREVHDTVAQSLFGIVYALDGLGRLLPDEPETVKAELEQIRQVAEGTRVEVRQSILDVWPSALTADVFERDLRRFVGHFCRPNELQLDVSVRGDFATLSPRLQRSLYRVAQEALTNVVKHAGAMRAEISLQVIDGRVTLSIRDDGRGFDPEAALSRERDREHFGLKGMRERIEALGGSCTIDSTPGHGTTINVRLPAVTGARQVARVG